MPIPALYATEHIPSADKRSTCTTSSKTATGGSPKPDRETGLAFGFACLHGDADNAEWGCIDLTELERLHQPGHIQPDDRGRPVRILPRLIIERDLHWTPTRAGDCQLPGWRATA